MKSITPELIVEEYTESLKQAYKSLIIAWQWCPSYLDTYFENLAKDIHIKHQEFANQLNKTAKCDRCSRYYAIPGICPFAACQEKLNG